MPRRVLLGGCAVLATAAATFGIALAAAGDGTVTVSPAVTVIRPAANTAGSASVTITNTGSGSATVGELVPDGTCDPGVTTTASPLPFTLAGGSNHALTISCAATPDTSIRRCEFHARTLQHAAVADYTGLCVSPGTLALALSPPNIVSFGDVPLGAEHTIAVTLTNPGGTKVTAEAIHVADQAGDFGIGSPCPTDGPGCDATAEIGPGSALSFDLRCSPTQLGARTTQLYVTTSNGGAAGPYNIDCNGVSGGTGPSLALDVTSLDVGAVAVASGSAASAIEVTNIGAADLHIASIAIAGGATTDWSFTVTSPCALTPCTLPPGGSFELDTAFNPTALAGRSSTIEIHSDDASHPTTVIGLTGTGVGATLAVGTDLGSGSGIELGSVAVGATSTFVLALRNDGNATLSPITLGLAQDDAVFAVTPASPTIAPSSTTTLTVTCTPTDHVASSGTLTITAASALVGSPIAIPLTCTGVAGSLVATPSPIQLGELRTGTGTQLVSIALSTLAAPVTISGAPALTTPLTAVTVGDLPSQSVTVATPVTFQLAIDPSADGPLDDHLTIPAGASTLDVPITGKIVTAAVTQTATRDLGSFCVGEPTATAAVSLTASGTASIGLPAAPALAQGDDSPFQIAPVTPSAFPYTLLSGTRATAAVTAKRQSTAGTMTDDVVWSDDVAATPSPHTTITATFIDDGGALSPGAVDFGSAPIHLIEPTDQVIVIQNCGTEAMSLTAPTIAPAGEFYTVGTLPQQLLPAQTATFAVGFGPVDVGEHTATLTIPATIGAQVNNLTVSLRGVGVITTPADTDAGTDMHPNNPGGCGCQSSDPAGGALLLAALAICRRRRRQIS
jgi:MYXO-CTERM domain-containing protein